MKGKKVFTKIFLAVAMTLCLMPTQVHAAGTELTATSEVAISSITLPKWENGSNVGQSVSDYLKAKLDTSTLEVIEQEEIIKLISKLKIYI